MSGLKTIAKKSLFLHRSYKFARAAPSIPTKRWRENEQLSAIFKVLPNTMVPIARLFDAYDAVESINQEGLNGDIIECGVWNGGCVGLMALAHAHRPGPQRRFHLFDSFEGLPLPSAPDIDAGSNWDEQQMPGGDEGLRTSGVLAGNSQPKVEEFLVERLRINRNDIIFHVGWFQETVPAAAPTIGEVSLLRLDGDLYESTRVCLEGFYNRVVKNGYIIIDDYGSFPGCRRAVDEFFDREGARPDFHYSDSECVFFRKP